MPVQQAVYSNTDKIKWHLEWEPAGTCRIINKSTGKTISGAANAIMQVEAPVKADELRNRNDLHWQIVEE
jgi:hypothetical protein